MRNSNRIRRSLVSILSLTSCGLLAAAAVAAQTTATTQAQGPSTGGADPARETEKHLLAYDTDAARRVLESLADATDPWIATARGRVLTQDGDYEAAAAELTKAAEADSGNPAPVFYLGEALAYAEQRESADGAYARAESRARRLLEAAPENPEALYFLGVAQQRQKRLGESAATLEQARSLRPEDPLISLQLGTTRFYQQQWQQAFDLLTAALDKNSGIAYAYYYRGLAAGKLNRKDLLYNDLDRFVKMAPNAPEAANAKRILSSFG